MECLTPWVDFGVPDPSPTTAGNLARSVRFGWCDVAKRSGKRGAVVFGSGGGGTVGPDRGQRFFIQDLTGGGVNEEAVLCEEIHAENWL